MSLADFAKQVLQGRLSILTGPLGSGKSTLLASLLSLLEKEFPGISAGGILCRALFQDQAKVGYELEQRPGGRRCLFALRHAPAGHPQSEPRQGAPPELFQEKLLECIPDSDRLPLGQWIISRKALRQGEEAIRRAVQGGCNLVVVDEFGPLELQGGGFRPAVDGLAESGKAGILVVREGLLEQVRQLYEAFISAIVPVAKVEVSPVVRTSVLPND